jgi:hypothetical protein
MGQIKNALLENEYYSELNDNNVPELFEQLREFTGRV